MQVRVSSLRHRLHTPSFSSVERIPSAFYGKHTKKQCVRLPATEPMSQLGNSRPGRTIPYRSFDHRPGAMRFAKSALAGSERSRCLSVHLSQLCLRGYHA